MISRLWLFLLDCPEGVDDDNAQIVKGDQSQSIPHYLSFDYFGKGPGVVLVEVVGGIERIDEHEFIYAKNERGVCHGQCH